MKRNFFAGGMTPTGFVDFFEHIMPLHAAHKRYFLKGSSGAGKSTFIKKIAAEVFGGDGDFFHCANDPTSLDAFAAQNFCIIDATHPHSRDPEIPAAVDEIIDFAKFLDAKKILPHLEEIKKISREKKNFYAEAQRILSAAKFLCTENSRAAETRINPADFQSHATRKLFLGALTPDGIKNFADDVLSRYDVFDINAPAAALPLFADCNVAGMSSQACATSREKSAFGAEFFFCPLTMKMIHIVLPREGIAFATCGGRFGYTGKIAENVDFSQEKTANSRGNFGGNSRSYADDSHEKNANSRGGFGGNSRNNAVDSQEKNANSRTAAREDAITDVILDAAFEAMKSAREAHEKIEKIFASAMNFSEVDKFAKKIIKNLKFQK